jgi:probable rRNA maturation factor
MKINIYNDQKKLKISSKLIQKQIKALLDYQKIKCDEIAIHLVDEKTLKRLHNKYFNDPSVTDTISFPIDSLHSTDGYCFLGEIFVSTDAAIKYGKSFNINPYDEIALYIIHGLLHLLGYDDNSDKEKTLMRKKEKSCMNFIKKNKLGISTNHIPLASEKSASRATRKKGPK